MAHFCVILERQDTTVAHVRSFHGWGLSMVEVLCRLTDSSGVIDYGSKLIYLGSWRTLGQKVRKSTG